MSRPVVVEGAASTGGSANPVAAAPTVGGDAETAPPSNNTAGTSSAQQRSIRKYAQWTEDMEECLMSQVKGRKCGRFLPSFYIHKTSTRLARAHNTK